MTGRLLLLCTTAVAWSACRSDPVEAVNHTASHDDPDASKPPSGDTDAEAPEDRGDASAAPPPPDPSTPESLGPLPSGDGELAASGMAAPTAPPDPDSVTELQLNPVAPKGAVWNLPTGNPYSPTYPVIAGLDDGIVLAGAVPLEGSDVHASEVFVARMDTTGAFVWRHVFAESGMPSVILVEESGNVWWFPVMSRTRTWFGTPRWHSDCCSPGSARTAKSCSNAFRTPKDGFTSGPMERPPMQAERRSSRAWRWSPRRFTISSGRF
jgi:hypothetical protein